MKKRLVCAAMACVLALGMALALSGCDNPFNKETYTPQGKEATVSSPTIGKNGILCVGVNASNPPMAGQASKIVGIDVDVAAAIADEWGLKLEIVDAGTNPLSALQAGTIDFALGYDTASSNENIAKSDAYIQKGVALFALDPKAGIPKAGSIIAAQTTSMSAWTVGTQFEDCTINNTADLKAAFAALSDGSAQYVAADAVIGMYAAKTSGVQASIVAMAQAPTGYCAATLSKNADLTKKVNETLKQLNSKGVIAVIEKKWLNANINLSATPLTPGAKTSDTKSSAEADSGDKKEASAN